MCSSNRVVSGQALASLGVVTFCFVLTLFIFIAPGWAWTHEIRGVPKFSAEVYGYYGIWWVCWELVETEIPGRTDCDLLTDHNFMPAWHKICMTLSIFLLLSGFCAQFCGSAYLCTRRANENRSVMIAVVVSCLLAAMFTVPLFVVYVVQFLRESYWCCEGGRSMVVRRGMNYAFIVACCVAPFYLVAAGISSLELSRLRKKDERARYHAKVARQSMRKKKVEEANANDGFDALNNVE